MEQKRAGGAVECPTRQRHASLERAAEALRGLVGALALGPKQRVALGQQSGERVSPRAPALDIAPRATFGALGIGVEAQPKLGKHWYRELGRRRPGRRAQIGSMVAQRRVGLVPNR